MTNLPIISTVQQQLTAVFEPLLSAAEIYDTLYDIDPRTMRGVCRQNFGAELRSFGAKRRKHHERRVYGVMRGEG